jgi:hypothetical protein
VTKSGSRREISRNVTAVGDKTDVIDVFTVYNESFNDQSKLFLILAIFLFKYLDQPYKQSGAACYHKRSSVNSERASLARSTQRILQVEKQRWIR